MLNLPKPLVTVVIPCHNYARFVVDAIRSVQAQTLNNFECMVVDDSSDDNSSEVIMAAIQGDSRFTIWHVDFHSLSATRNYGISHGTGTYLCCLDADDMMGNENYLEVMVTALEKDKTLGITFSCLQVMDVNGKLGHVPTWPNGWDFEAQCNHINQIPSLCVFSREMWSRAGGFRPYYRYVEDAEFWTTCGMLGYGAIHATTEPWFRYRLHDKSASQVHRTGEIPEPDWLEYHPGARDGQRPFAAGGKPPHGSWPVRFYNEPDVSIIIPVGVGHEEVVKDALHSVEGQTHRMWECIVVNDTGYDFDLTGFPWVKVIHTKKLGAGGARNWGMHYTKAPFIVCLDADDMLKPNFLERTLAIYRQQGRYVYTDWLTHDKMTNWQIHTTPEYSFEAIKTKPSMHPVTCLIPRKWFMDVGGFDESLPSFEDVDLFMKLHTHGYCGVRVPEPLLIYNLGYGTRRKESEGFEPTFKSILKKRYGAYMEGDKMCDCVKPPQGKQPMAPSPDNADEYREAYGEMILAKLVGAFVAEAPVTFRGPATHVNYGRRAKGDVFYVWQADIDNGGDTFERVENYDTEPEPTVIPPAPPTLTSEELEAHADQLEPGEWNRLHLHEWPSPSEHNTKPLPGDFQGDYISDDVPRQEAPPEPDTKTILEQPVVKVDKIPTPKTPKTVVSNPRRGGKNTATKTPKGGNKTK